MSWITAVVPTPVTIILKYADAAPNDLQTFRGQKVKRVARTMVDCRATTYSRLSEDHELTLFRAAGSLRIPGQTASVTGLETMNINQATDYFQAITGPQSVFITAMAWDMIDMAKHYTKIANRLTLRGDYDRARARYWNIIHLPVKEGILFTSPPAIYTSDAAGPAVVFSRILHDAAASYGLLSLRALNTVEAEIGEEYSHRLCAFLSGFDDRDQILGFADQPRATWLVVSGAWHLSLLLMAAKATSISDIDDVLLKFQDLRERRPRSKHVAHDIAQLRDVRENCEVSLLDIFQFAISH